jgi:hypothetical protein
VAGFTFASIGGLAARVTPVTPTCRRTVRSLFAAGACRILAGAAPLAGSLPLHCRRTVSGRPLSYILVDSPRVAAGCESDFLIEF